MATKSPKGLRRVSGFKTSDGQVFTGYQSQAKGTKHQIQINRKDLASKIAEEAMKVFKSDMPCEDWKRMMDGDEELDVRFWEDMSDYLNIELGDFHDYVTLVMEMIEKCHLEEVIRIIKRF